MGIHRLVCQIRKSDEYTQKDWKGRNETVIFCRLYDCLHYHKQYKMYKRDFFFFSLFPFSRATPRAYGDSQARSLIRTVATGLHQSHSNEASELQLRPTPQLTAMPDP